MGRFGAAAALLSQALADDGPTGGVLQALLVTYGTRDATPRLVVWCRRFKN